MKWNSIERCSIPYFCRCDNVLNHMWNHKVFEKNGKQIWTVRIDSVSMIQLHAVRCTICAPNRMENIWTKNERRHTCTSTYIVHSNQNQRNILFKQFRWRLLQWKREFSAEKEINKWNTSRCCRWCCWRWMVRYDEICSECVSSASRY